MRPGQEFIYYLTGDSPDNLARIPHLEGFKAKGVEVLFLTDPIDEFWLQAVPQFQGKSFRSITRGGAELSKITGTADGSAEPPATPSPPSEAVAKLAKLFQEILQAEVKSVELSERLTESAVCLVAEADGLDLNFEKLLKQHQRLEKTSKRILEINPKHPLITKLSQQADAGISETMQDAAWLLLAEARLSLGEALSNPADFARRLERGVVVRLPHSPRGVKAYQGTSVTKNTEASIITPNSTSSPPRGIVQIAQLLSVKELAITGDQPGNSTPPQQAAQKHAAENHHLVETPDMEPTISKALNANVKNSREPGLVMAMMKEVKKAS